MEGYKKTFSLLIGGLILGTSLMACGIFGPGQEETTGELSKEEEIVLDQAIEERIQEPAKKSQSPEGDTIKSKWGPDSATAVRKYSLYYQYYKQNNYKMAYPYWRWMFFNAPRQSENIYIRGVNILEHKFEQAPKAQKDEYLDTLMMVYDKRIKYFNQKGEVLGRKGKNLVQLDPDQARRAFDILKKSLELKGEESKSFVPYYYLQAAVELKKKEKMDKSQLMDAYNKAIKIVNANLEEGSGGEWQDAKGNISTLMDPYLSCADLIDKYKSKFEEQKDNLQKLKSFQNQLENKECTKDPFYLKLTESIFDSEPSADIAVSLARQWKQKNNNDKAIKFYKKAIELEEKDEKATDYALKLASIYKEQKENLLKARDYAKKAINLDDENGKAHIFLGELYITGRDRCGEKFERKAVLWAAVDEFKKAKQVDPSVEEAADKRISSYRQRFPKKQDVFFRNLEEGDPYKVECWINEKTTVRHRPE